jgi:hypothetical protein
MFDDIAAGYQHQALRVYPFWFALELLGAEHQEQPRQRHLQEVASLVGDQGLRIRVDVLFGPALPPA